MKKICTWLLCLLVFVMALPIAVSAADASESDGLDKLVTMTAPQLSGGTVTADLVLTENHGLTGLQVGISYNSNLLKEPTVTLANDFFDELITAPNGNCPIFTFLGGKKSEGGVFATITFQVTVDGLAAEDLLIYLLPRDKMDGDYTIYPAEPDPGENPGENPGGDNPGGSSGSGSGSGGGSIGGAGNGKPNSDKPTSDPVTTYPDKAGTGLWVQHEDGSWTFEKGEKPVSGWQQIDQNWYFFDAATAKMQTNWVKDAGKWYYLSDSGAMKTGWVLDNGKWYYLAKGGAMKTGWVLDNGKWYYLAADGGMKTGWVLDSGKWYYLAKDGAMYSGWIMHGGKWYYLDKDGHMLTNTVTPDGHQLDENGVWIS